MLNMAHLDLTKKWAEEDVHAWDFLEIISAVASVSFLLYEMKVPRNFTQVMQEFIDKFPSFLPNYKIDTIIMFETTLNKLCKKIDECLMTIDEFVKWNLTDEEYEHDVDVNGPRTEYFKHGDHFVDLTAFNQNVYCSLRSKLIEDYFFEAQNEE